ncbi:MAG: hypothetical protein COA42_09075 [Alteromonadaceae bacterium]|nr:MAG: hypothetical protein COA42_09075 [Alteromonadaceae bacterium]
MTQTFSWLHLTDLHWGLQGCDELWPKLCQTLAEDIVTVQKTICTSYEAIFFTGDIVQNGDASQFNTLNDRLRELKQAVEALSSEPFDPYFFAVPGNHDLERPAAELVSSGACKLIDHWQDDPAIQEAIWSADSTSPYFQLVKKAFQNYQQWWDNFDVFKKPKIKSGLLPGDFSANFNLGNYKIGVVGLNSSFLQLDNRHYEGRLELDQRQMDAVCESVNDWPAQQVTNFLLTHHSANWLSDKGLKAYQEMLDPEHFAFHLCGHMHDSRTMNFKNNRSEKKSRIYQSSSLMGLDGYSVYDRGDITHVVDRRHGYSVGKLTFKEGKLYARLWPREVNLRQRANLKFVPDFTMNLPFDSEGRYDGGTRAVVVGAYCV